MLRLFFERDGVQYSLELFQDFVCTNFFAVLGYLRTTVAYILGLYRHSLHTNYVDILSVAQRFLRTTADCTHAFVLDYARTTFASFRDSSDPSGVDLSSYTLGTAF